jgi:hypothetical protein
MHATRGQRQSKRIRERNPSESFRELKVREGSPTVTQSLESRIG